MIPHYNHYDIWSKYYIHVSLLRIDNNFCLAIVSIEQSVDTLANAGFDLYGEVELLEGEFELACEPNIDFDVLVDAL